MKKYLFCEQCIRQMLTSQPLTLQPFALMDDSIYIETQLKFYILSNEFFIKTHCLSPPVHSNSTPLALDQSTRFQGPWIRKFYQQFRISLMRYSVQISTIVSDAVLKKSN
jgi:hypothetical protein